MTKKIIETVFREITVGGISGSGRVKIKLIEVKVGKFDTSMLEDKSTDPENRSARFYLKFDRNNPTKIQITTDIAGAYKIYGPQDESIFVKRSSENYKVNINDTLSSTYKEISSFNPLAEFVASDKPPVKKRDKKKKKK